MESLEASWSSFNATVPVQSSEMMGHLHGAYPFPSECGGDSSLGISSMFQSNYDLDSYYYSSHNDHPSLYHWPQGNCSSSGSSCASLFSPRSIYESYYFSASNVVPATNNGCIPIDVCTAEEEVDPSSLQNVVSHQFEDPICFSEETSSDSPGDPSLKRKLYKAEVGMLAIHEDEMSTESPKKKARASMQIQSNSKNVQPKNTQKNAKTANKEDSRASSYGQNSSCYSSEDDSNASQELNDGGGANSTSKVSPALNLNGKKRASRGSATDPQSLYARKRRERINERLRILQNLVPNGTKVDISTMLEEAVQYVKLLQLQIKLLSSDDLWMYAPIAYNGMNIGLDLKFSPLQQ